MSKLVAPRDDLFRTVLNPTALRAERGESPVMPAATMHERAVSLRAAAAEAKGPGTLFGYAAVFDSWTEISGWEGNFLERLVRGSFKKTIKERADWIIVQFDHGWDWSIGDKPLGVYDVLREDETGLYHETPLADVSYTPDIAELVRIQAIKGQSFRFSVVREVWRNEPGISDYNPKGLPERDILEVKLYEFGPVTFPAYQATTIGIRSRDQFRSWRDARNTAPDAGDSATSAHDDAPPEGTRSGKAAGESFFRKFEYPDDERITA